MQNLTDHFASLPNPQKRRIFQLSEILFSKVIPQNPHGFTVDPSDNFKPIFEKDVDSKVYIVSLKDHEQRFFKFPRRKDLFEWLVLHYEFYRCPKHFVGGWANDGFFYLNISIEVCGLDKALLTAIENDQQAIYHPSSQKTIFMPNSWPQVI